MTFYFDQSVWFLLRMVKQVQWGRPIGLDNQHSLMNALVPVNMQGLISISLEDLPAAMDQRERERERERRERERERETVMMIFS